MNQKSIISQETIKCMQQICAEENEIFSHDILENLFWNAMFGADEDFQLILNDLYHGVKSFRQSLFSILSIIAYNDKRHLIENIQLVKTIKQAVTGNDWKLARDSECGDYDPKCKNVWLNCIFSIYDNILNQINLRDEIAKNNTPFNNTNPWEIEIPNAIPITKDIYFQKNNISVKRESLKRQLNDPDVTPEIVVSLIGENFEYLYNYKSTYEALQFCILCCDEIADNPANRKSLRDFCRLIEK